MSKRGDIEFLNDIDEAIRRIEFYTQDTDYENFLEDIKTQDAVSSDSVEGFSWDKR